MAEQILRIATVPDSDYVIFDGTGELTLRKIFTAFFWRFLDGQITENRHLFWIKT
jgi:glucose-6-phosphate 1-dehydrogenase